MGNLVDRIRNQFFRKPTAIEPTAPESTAIERSMGEGGMTAQLTDANPFSGFGYVNVKRRTRTLTRV